MSYFLSDIILIKLNHKRSLAFYINVPVNGISVNFGYNNRVKNEKSGKCSYENILQTIISCYKIISKTTSFEFRNTVNTVAEL